MISSPPRLRNDLALREEQVAGATVLVVKDPASGDFFRLGEAEHFIARQFDGETSVELIRQRAEARFGAPVSAETICAFARSLDVAGLLAGGEAAAKERSRRRGRIRGNLLRLRFVAADPNRVFGRWARRARSFFTPQFMVLSALLILLASATAATHWAEITQELSSLYTLSSIPLLVVVIFVVVSAHEIAHGLTCRHFGGEVHEVGFMLMYFQPAFYCNVSDAWLFGDKSRRMWVGFAGPYFELLICALAVLTWRLTAVDTWINHVALVVMATTGIKTLVNFVPLIKLDGYYLLSDYLGIPNLRRKSFRYVGDSLKRLSGWGDVPDEKPAARERRIFLVYGWVAIVFSLSLLAVATIKLGGRLIETGEPLALVAVFGLLGARFRNRLVKLFGRAEQMDDETAAPVEGAAEPNGARTSRRTRRSRRRWRRRIGFLAVLTLGAVVAAVGRLELRIGGPFTVLPVHNADVRPEVDGFVEEIFVREGDTVHAGQVVAHLADREQRAELARTAADIAQARARLRLLEAGPTEVEIELARAAVQKAEDRLTFARARSDRNKLLAETRTVSQAEYEDSHELTTIAVDEVAEARHKLNVVLAGSRRESIDATRAEVARLEAHRLYVEGQIQRAQVRSPASGIVATPERELREMMRKQVAKGELIAKVFDVETLLVEIAIPEKEIAEIRVGQAVRFKAAAYPNRTFDGRVTSIATVATSNKTILVTTQLHNASRLVKPGMTGHAKVLCGERRIFELMTRRLARTIKVEFWSLL